MQSNGKNFFDDVDGLVSRLAHGFFLGVTALAAAALDGKLDIVRYLLDNGADPNKKDLPGTVPLHCAAQNGHHEVVRFLLSRGASVDIAYFHGTPLHIAAARGKPSVMRVLLEHHADPNKVSEELGTPLVAALYAQGQTESAILRCVKLLIEAGADVNSTDPDTPLVVASAQGLIDCIKYLLKAGGDPNIHGDQVEQCGKHTKAEINKHTKAELKKPTKAELKFHGDKAVGRKDYLAASNFYTEAIELDPNDAMLYSNRSLCHLKIGEATKALSDADTCIMMRPEWLKGYYRKGAALMSLKEYEGACGTFMAGLKLDPNNADVEIMFWQAVEAMKKEHIGRKNLDSID